MGPSRRFASGIQSAVVIGFTVGMISACSQSPGSPPSPPLLPAAPSAIPTPGDAPAVTEVLPSVGSTAGGASIKIVGTGFMPGMMATLDGIKLVAGPDFPVDSFRTFYSETPAHDPGTVELVVTNPDGQSHRIEAGYRYAPPESFDLNGDWGGFSLNGTDTWVEFVIRDNRLVSASCSYNSRVDLTFTESPSSRTGEFSIMADGGATISGRILSPSEMAGTISVPSCTTTPLPWRANRKTD
jgi:hypothetical protein